jgi:fused signal recognition particle receptor
MIGVNGVGKTTTIGKLSSRFRSEGRSVLLAAGDTFRAAAVEQLEIWAQRTGASIIKHQSGSDPAAVAFDAVEAAKSRGSDVVIIDTAGRLHTKSQLMDELKKVDRVIKKAMPDAPHEKLLVIDATTGQNALRQAKIFNEAVGLTGIVLTKLDGTAKGGIIFAIQKEVNIPVKLIGIGEGVEDLRDFDPRDFVSALFE